MADYNSSYTGEQIDDSVGKRYLSGSTDPTTSTVGKLGQHYFNTNTKKDYICTGVSGSVYTWELVESPSLVYLPFTAVSGTGTTRTIALSESAFIYTLSITNTNANTLAFTTSGLATDKRIVFRIEITTTVASVNVTFPSGTWAWDEPSITDAGEYWFAVEGKYSGWEWEWTFEQVRG